MTDPNAPDRQAASTRSHPNPKLDRLRLPSTIDSSNPYYCMMRWGLRFLLPTFWKARVYGRHNEPSEGGVVYISNHQSFLDPMLVGFGLVRPLNYMARSTLFDTPGLNQLMSSLNAFPVKRGTADTGALKEAMRRIKRGGQVLVFAEGTRTKNGRIAPFLPGVSLLAQRAAQWIVPVVIDGAFEAWPRDHKFCHCYPVRVMYGRAISPEQIRADGDEGAALALWQQQKQMQQELRKQYGREPFIYND